MCCGARFNATIMTLKSAIIHQFSPAPSNDSITSTHMMSDSSTCPACFFQTVTAARNKLESCGQAFFQGLKGILEGRKVRSGYLPFRTNASTLSSTPK
ncbi:hypothetical protein TNCV_5054981 [Trichonephila clavipes]|nr:hypothetical protein TNCV_5054981 [Trichonephila clavipes]